MKKILCVLLYLLTPISVFSQNNLPYIEGAFYNNNYGIKAEGLLWVNNNRYIKSAVMECNYETTKCNLIIANLVNNGDFLQSLYPTLETFDIIEKNKNIIILKASNSSYIYIDLNKQTIKNLSKDFILHTNQEEIKKILTTYNEK